MESPGDENGMMLHREMRQSAFGKIHSWKSGNNLQRISKRRLKIGVQVANLPHSD
jgi:hypothetical protein